MCVSDFITRWLEVSPAQCNSENHASDDHCSVLYLKDWHFVKVSMQTSLLNFIPLSIFSPLINLFNMNYKRVLIMISHHFWYYWYHFKNET